MAEVESHQKERVLCLLKSFQSLKTPNHLKSLHVHLLRTGLYNSSFAVGNFIINCAKRGLMNYAAKLFDRMLEPNSFVWNTLIRGFQQNQDSRNALLYFDRMRVQSIKPDHFTYPFVIRACSDFMDFPRGSCIHGKVFRTGLGFDLFIGTSLVEFYCGLGEMKAAQRAFDELPVKDEITWTVILSGYMNNSEDMERASELFHDMPNKDLMAWNTMIGGYVKVGDIEHAMSHFRWMQTEKVTPNEMTLVSILSACARTGALNMGRWIHSYIGRKNLSLNVVLGTALVDMYCKCSDLESAERVFDRMLEHDVIAWNAMIMGFSMNGQSSNTLKFFYRMKNEAVRPNDATILGVLCACVHGGMVEEGRKCFNDMSQEFSLSPKLEHYGCMVDLLGRAGLLEEAYNLIQFMPLVPDTNVWGALLGACKVHGNIELAERAIEVLIQLEHRDGGYLAIMSNIYANAGRWNDAMKVRKLLRDEGFEKLRGFSSIDKW